MKAVMYIYVCHGLSRIQLGLCFNYLNVCFITSNLVSTDTSCTSVLESFEHLWRNLYALDSLIYFEKWIKKFASLDAVKCVD